MPIFENNDITDNAKKKQFFPDAFMTFCQIHDYYDNVNHHDPAEVSQGFFCSKSKFGWSQSWWVIIIQYQMILVLLTDQP